GVRGPLRPEREPNHPLARGARRRALDHVRNPLVDAGSAGQPGIAGYDNDRLSPLGPRYCASRGLPRAHERGGLVVGTLCGFLLILMMFVGVLFTWRLKFIQEVRPSEWRLHGGGEGGALTATCAGSVRV